MNVSPLYPLLLGITTKLYDDITDIGWIQHEGWTEILKSMMIVFLVWTSQGDFYFSFSCFLVSLINSGFDTPFWNSITFVTGALLLYNLPFIGERWLYKILSTFVVTMGILVIASFEDRLFPEEVSREKIIFRIVCVIVFIGMSVLPWMDWFHVPRFSRPSIQKTTILMGSNMFVSVLTMGYLLGYSGKTLEELNPGCIIWKQP